MFLLRLIGGLGAIGIAYGISALTEIDLATVCAFLAFILITDNLIVKWLSAQYLKMVLEELEKPNKDK